MNKEDYMHAEFDALLVSPDIMENPYPIYRRLRDEMPAMWSENWQSWVFSRYEDVGASLKDKINLSNKRRQALLFNNFSEQELKETEFLRTFFDQQDIRPHAHAQAGPDGPDAESNCRNGGQDTPPGRGIVGGSRAQGTI
jgi:cytochrome P450